MSDVFCCREVVQLLLDYVEGALPADERAAVEAHFEACPRCLEFLESYRATPRLMREATAAEMPEDVAAGLQRLLEGMRRGS
jgi:anti-sigma factor RsiW